MPRTALTYDSVDEATRRLVGSVVTYDGEPVSIVSVENHADGVLRVLFRAWPYNGELIRKKINSPRFRRFATPPLGFMNFFAGRDANCAWVERQSRRTQRQGLTSEDCVITRLQSMDRVDFGRAYSSDAFREMIVGEYPSFDMALDRLVPNSSIAVSRDFALVRNAASYTFLNHRRDEVGLILRGLIYLRNDRQHLVETIVECAALPDRVEIM